MGIDDLQRQIEEDERNDRLALLENPKLTPIDYGKLRGIRPQAVYRALRLGKLTWDTCDCGRRVVVVSEADELFGKGKDSERTDLQALRGERNSAEREGVHDLDGS